MASEGADPGLSGYAVIAARNLFNPGRSETATAAAVPVAKPILHGVVIDGPKSRAFLEDPAAKRVAATRKPSKGEKRHLPAQQNGLLLAIVLCISAG